MNTDLATFLLALGLLSFAGCSPSPVDVAGRVTLDAQPLGEAAIQFVPLEPGQKKAGAEVKAGQYHLVGDDALLPGKYRVDLVDLPSLGNPLNHLSGAAKRRPFPHQYSTDSPFEVEIQPGADAVQLDFELQSRPSPPAAPGH